MKILNEAGRRDTKCYCFLRDRYSAITPTAAAPPMPKPSMSEPGAKFSSIEAGRALVGMKVGNGFFLAITTGVGVKVAVG